MLECLYGGYRLLARCIKRNENGAEDALDAANPAEKCEFLLEHDVTENRRDDNGEGT